MPNKAEKITEKAAKSLSKLRIGIIIITLAVIGAAGILTFSFTRSNDTPSTVEVEKFRLSDNLYGKAELKEITATEYEELINSKTSFLILVHMSICPAELPLTDTTKQFMHGENITIYSMLQDELKESSLSETVRYLPSIAIIKEGEVIKFLDAESNDDIPVYKSPEALKNWVTTYVEL